ncbi:MAG: DUF1428 domain-containing protein [Pseudomonadota bacterium]
MPYIDCFMAAVPTNNREVYLEQAKISAQVFKDHGAISIIECWGDDIPDGKLTSFPLAVKCEPEETVVIGWVTWPDKPSRDAAMPKVMQDKRMEMASKSMPFDTKRLVFGGFDVLLELR